MFVHDVIAAITTWPWSSSRLRPVGQRHGRRRTRRGRPPGRRPSRSRPRSPRCSGGCVASCGAVGSLAGKVSSSGSSHASASGTKPSSDIRNDALDSVSETRSCGRLGPASDGTTSARSSSSVSEYVGFSESLVVPQALRLGVGLDALDLLRRAAGELQVAERLGVDREDRAGGAELRRHVADRRPVGEREVRDARAVELDELAHDAVLAQHLRDGEHEVGRGRALAQLADELEADARAGSASDIGWPSMAASASIPPTPQPSTPRPLIIVVWESVPTSVSG